MTFAAFADGGSDALCRPLLAYPRSCPIRQAVVSAVSTVTIETELVSDIICLMSLSVAAFLSVWSALLSFAISVPLPVPFIEAVIDPIGLLFIWCI